MRKNQIEVLELSNTINVMKNKIASTSEWMKQK